MHELEKQYPGTYEIKISLGGGIVLIYEHWIGLEPSDKRVVRQWEHEDDNYEHHLDRFAREVAEANQ
jgi:hypothetical protein